LIDLDEKSDGALAALKAAAAAKGWALEAMGAPTRLLVVSAPADVLPKAVEVQRAYAARMLAVKASGAYENRVFRRAFTFAQTVLALDPKHAGGHLIVGRLMAAEGIQAKQAEGEKADEIIAAAVKHLRAAFAKDATGTLSAGERASGLGELGLALLYTKKADAEARDALKEAVAGTFDTASEGAIARYNLACAHGRLKEIDAAFEHLALVLAAETKSPGNAQLLQAWQKDEDFTNLHGDPRWAELVKQYPAPAGSGD
jgi:tetratricopeptide (TPR) repeat protein